MGEARSTRRVWCFVVVGGREVSDSLAGLNAGISVVRRVEERGEIASQRYFTFGKAQGQPCPPTGPSDSRHASTRAGTLQELSCNGIILNDLRIKNADAGAESTSNSSKLGRQTGNAPTSFPKIICL
jgi:hypothetical protein